MPPRWAMPRFDSRGGNGRVLDGITSRVRCPQRRREMTVDTMEKLLINELKDIYSAEKQITRALPKMAKQASNTELKTAFETHLKETEGQIKRLDRVCEILGNMPGAKRCKGTQGLTEADPELGQETE